MARLMKNSGIQWIGDIPQHWKIIRLKNCISQRDSGAWGENIKNNENDIVCIRIADFDYSKMTIKNFVGYEFTKRNYKKDIINKLQLHLNDILIEKSGGGEKTPVGRTIIFNKNFPCLFSNFMDRLRANKIIINPKFLQYMFVTFYTNGYVKNYIKQTTGIQNLDITSLLSNENVSLPPIEEQQRIANYLDEKCSKIDETIEKEKAIIEKLKEYKQSLITETVTKGLNPNVPMKDSGIDWIGSIPQHWETHKLKNMFNFRKGLPITKENLVENGIKVISYGQIHSKENKGTKLVNSLFRYVSPNYLNTNSQSLVHKNDFIFADTSEDLKGTGNNVYIDSDENIFAGYHSIILSPIEKKNTKYLAYLFQTDCWRSQSRSRVTGIKLFSITQKILNQTTIIYPPMEEQKEIAKYLDEKCNAIDNAITQRETLIDKLTEYKKSLIYECVTGKKEI